MVLFPKVGRKQLKVRLAWWLMVGLLCFGVLTHLFPFYIMIVTSITPAAETLSTTPTLWTFHPTLAAWKLIFQWTANTGQGALIAGSAAEPFWVYFWNSFFMTSVTLIVSIPIVSMAAYATSKLLRGPLARWTFMYFIATLMVPFAVTLLPSLLLVNFFPFALPYGSIPNLPGTYQPFPTASFVDTLWAIIIPGIFNAYNYLIFKGYFDTIPNSILQAARVDGGSEFNIFRRIVFPMSIPVYAVIAWIQFSAVWDSFLWPQLVIQSNSKAPTSLAIYTLMNDFVNSGIMDRATALSHDAAMQAALASGLSWNGLMVLGLLQTLPIFIVFILCREYLLRGVRIQGLK
ncbi:MAG TPA: carbohydrate ABC transporter permease [Ktedonobacteraceae bacterium]|jgi:multiple sugar transport system permease protein|nr:carbohydrate ABC transporter permease [Ktedonobacteraceae bacterium]